MKVYVERETRCWINGKEYIVQQGIQDLPEEVASVLLNAKEARKIEDVKDAVEEKKKR